jgi:DNA-binding MarR family transcriptional regulator
MAERPNKRQDLGASELLGWIASGYRLESKVEAALEPHGLSLPKWNVLTHLADSGRSLALSEIAAKLNCVRSNVTQLIDRLEGDGLVRRLYDPSDRRTVRAELTDDGRRRQAEGAQALVTVGKGLGSVISAADRAALARLASALE